MDIVIIKFGGTSISNDENLSLAAQRTIDFIKQGKKVVVVLSAQGKTTDILLNEVKTLSKIPNKRELDVLASVGEQISIAKFTILLNDLGYKAISLTGWQAGIITNSNYTDAKIQNIKPDRIYNELKNNDVVAVAGFQGIDEYQNITTLGRNGSDTTAISLAVALKQKKCYIFTDIDGVYDKDPNKYTNAKKLDQISYNEMNKLAVNGAKVLHDRCITMAEKNNIKIIVKSTFKYNNGTIVG